MFRSFSFFATKMWKILAWFCLVQGTYSDSASFIKACKEGDQACLAQSAIDAMPTVVEGVPELGIKSLDPMQIPLIESNNNGLKLTFKDTTLTGLKGCSLEDIKFDPAKKRITLKVKCSVKLIGKYNVDGKLLLMPVFGDGDYAIDIQDVQISANLDIVTNTGKDEQTHWHIKKWNHSYDVITGAKFRLDNLFGGNKALGQPVLDFLNMNWKIVMQEVASPIFKVVVGYVIDAIDAVFKIYPVNELVLA